MSPAVRPGPSSVEGLAWLARVGASPAEPLSLVMGWGRRATFSHLARLQDAGWIERVATVHGQGSLIVVTARGVAMAGDLGVRPPRSLGPSIWAHAAACAWVAAWLEVRGRPWLSTRELMLDPAYATTVSYGDREGHMHRVTHRPDLATRAEERPVAVEVELQRKRLARLRAILAMYEQWCTLEQAGGGLRGVVYVTGSEGVARTVKRVADELALPARGVLRLRPLDEVIEETRGGGPRMTVKLAAVLVLSLVVGGVVLGAGGAWWLRRRSTLTIRNVYGPAVVLTIGTVLAATQRSVAALALLAGPTVASVTASVVGRRWRLSDLGAGEDLRRHERERRWVWQPAPAREDGERVFIAGQGELVRERSWPADEPFVPMTADDRARVPRNAGRHVAAFGATGSGKTTSVLRAAAGRTLADHAALLLIDQKGDPPTEEMLRRVAATARRPFILLDPKAADTDHWQPVWGQPSEVVARALAGIQTSEPYYADVLRQHVTLVAEILTASGQWPPSLPALCDAAQLRRYRQLAHLATQVAATHPEIARRAVEHEEWVGSRDGRQALSGGLVRLDLVVGAWREVLSPRAAGGARVAVSLPEAIGRGAVVLWRTHVDEMPEAAEAITTLALADIHAAAVAAGGAPWSAVLDEFGAVVATAAPQALGLLQRGRTHNGQVYVVTQSVADIEALTGQVGLLASLSDNFSAFVAHRQVSPESRDWLAKLMGTTALWSSTDQTAGHGSVHTGAGTRRRVREFRVASDTFAQLRTGEAIIHTTLGPPPVQVRVTPVQLPDREPPRINGAQHPCETPVTTVTLNAAPDVAIVAERAAKRGSAGRAAPAAARSISRDAANAATPPDSGTGTSGAAPDDEPFGSL